MDRSMGYKITWFPLFLLAMWECELGLRIFKHINVVKSKHMMLIIESHSELVIPVSLCVDGHFMDSLE